MEKHSGESMDYSVLLNKAAEARNNAYAPYSGFKVGAALLTSNGDVFTGCNVENAAYGESICAERVAITKAVSEGEKHFEAIAIVGGKDELSRFCPPCGSCRQVLAEFCSPNFKIVFGDSHDYKVYALSELMPLSFGKNSLE